MPECAEGWHRKIRQLYDYWRSIHPPTGLPGRQHLDPAAICDLLPLIWLVDIQHAPLRFRYRLIGTGHVAAMGRDLTGRWMDEAHENFLTHASYSHYVGMVTTKAPSHRRGPPGFHVNSDFLTMERIMLPMARDGETVDLILALTVYFYKDGTEAFF